MWVDTHCHLNDKAFTHDVQDVIARAREAGGVGFIIPGADPLELEEAIRLAECHEDIYFAAGIHPYDIQKGSIEDLEKYLSHPKCVAVGECGLDYYRLPEEEYRLEYKQRQKEVFIQQIELSIKYDLPLILHVREASFDTAEILRCFPSARGVFHCFNADSILLDFKERFYYGIGGVCTFKNARRLVEVLPLIPLERIVLETDAPYLAPTPHRGERNESAFIPLIAQRMGEILRRPMDFLEKQSTQNAQNLFGLSLNLGKNL